MQKQAAKRKLTTILYADIVEYSRLTGKDELNTHHRVMDALDFSSNSIQKNNGTVLRFAGDAILAEFQSVVDCVNASIRIQTELFKRNESLAEENKVQFRIGINLGEVLEDRNEIFGEGVNVAARLEASAFPGGINLSEIVHDQINGKVDHEFQPLGSHEFKNVEKPVQVYSWQPEALSNQTNSTKQSPVREIKLTDNAKLHIKLLDFFELSESNGGAIHLNNSKAEAIIAYLALSSDGKETRKNLAELLWSRHAEEQARASLRQCLSHLKRKLSKVDKNLILADRQTISINKSLLARDVDFIVQKRDDKTNKLELLLQGWDGEILVGLEGIDTNFDTWLMEQRKKYLDIFAISLCKDLNQQLENNSTEPIYAHFLLKVDPVSDLAHRALMAHYLEMGDESSAISQYKLLSARLNQLNNGSPSSQTEALYTQIEDTQNRIGVETNKPISSKPVLAICPFEIMGNLDPQAEPLQNFKDILYEQLTTNLSQFREFSVKDGVKVTSDIINGKSFDDIKILHNVDYILRASFIYLNETAKLNFRLVSCASGMQVWADMVDFEMNKIFLELEGTLLNTIGVIKHILTYDKYESMPLDMTAYDYWLKGSVAGYSWKNNEELDSIKYYEKAIELDPSLSRAYSSLAAIYNVRNIVLPGNRTNDEDREKGRQLASKAIEIDALDSRNHLNLAWGYHLDGEFENAENHFRRAYRLNPNSANIAISYALAMGYLGYSEEVVKVAEKAFKLNPTPPSYYYAYMGALYYLNEQYPEAVETFKKMDHCTPNFIAWFAVSLLKNDMPELAKATVNRFIETAKEQWDGESIPNKEQVIGWLKTVVMLKRTQDKVRLFDEIENLAN